MFCVNVDKWQFLLCPLHLREKDDIIILAGKGHETYQDIQGVKHHLDEREEVANYLLEMRNL